MPLNNNEKYVVQGMLRDGIGIKKISEALDKPYKTVQNYVEKYRDSIRKIEENKVKEEPVVEELVEEKPAEKKKPKKLPPQPKPVTVLDMMTRKTLDKKNGNVAIMTRGASEKSDEALKHYQEPDLSSRIHKIKED